MRQTLTDKRKEIVVRLLIDVFITKLSIEYIQLQNVLPEKQINNITKW